MNIDFRILELACSKLCHDVISPIGAVNNGLELLEDEEDAALKAEALALAQKSAKRASILLQVYRTAFGNAGNQSSFGPREALSLGADFLSGGKISLAGPVPPDSSGFPGGFGKLLLNMILLASDTLPRGGKLEVQVKEPTASSVPLEIFCIGQQILWTPEMALAVTDKADPEALTPQNVLGYVTGAVAGKLDCTILAHVPAEPGNVVLRAARR